MKRGPVAKSVAEYLSRVPEPARGTLKKVRAAIRAAAPKGATEAISYGMPMFRYKGQLVGYAAFAKHCSLFPGGIVDEFKDELEGYKTSKGTIQFPVDKPLPAALIKKLVKFSAARNELREEIKARKK
jgi:uncharacterized protein YdhG (YjbR/CyaY superfamily)